MSYPDSETLARVLRYVVGAREIECLHRHPAPDPSCARCVADAADKNALTDEMMQMIGYVQLKKRANHERI